MKTKKGTKILVFGQTVKSSKVKNQSEDRYQFKRD